MEEKIVKAIEYINEILEKFACHDCVIEDTEKNEFISYGSCWRDFLKNIKELLDG